MEKLKKYLKPTIKIVIISVLYLALLTLLSHTGILSLTTISKINFSLVALISFMGGVHKGKKASKKGYLEGLKLGGIAIMILFVLNILFYRTFNLYVFLYYLVILVGSIIGSMIGINLHR